MQPSRGLMYVPTSRGWVQAYPARPFNSQAPPAPAGVNHHTWHNGYWQENPTFHRAVHVQDRAMWVPHPAWNPWNPTAPPPIVEAEQIDLSRVPWLWVPKGIDVNHPTGHPALSQGGYYQDPQTEDTLPLSIPASPSPDLDHAYASERLRNRRGTPHPHPGQLPPVDVDEDYGLSPNYGPFRMNASPRVANASTQQHARGASRGNTYSSFGTPESTMSPPVIPPPVIPSSSSSYHPSHDYPSGSPHPRTRQYPSSSSYPGLPPRNNPLPPPPKHHPLAQCLLRSANRPTASEATAEPNHRQREVRDGHRDRRDDRKY